MTPSSPHPPPRRYPGTALLRPAVALMNRLSYPKKFALISLLLALPFALVTYLLTREINARIEFSERELDGDKYLRPLRRMLEHTLHSHLLAQDFSPEDVARKPELRRKLEAVQEDFLLVTAAQKELGTVLQTH